MVPGTNRYWHCNLATIKIKMGFASTMAFAAACALFALVAEALLAPRMSRMAAASRCNTGPLMALKLKEITLPLQSDPSKYETLLHEIVLKAKIIRWYIARISDGKDAVIEVIIEE